MRRASILTAVVSAGLAMACADSPVAPEAGIPEASFRRGAGAQTVSVMTRNLYIGADVDQVIAALATGDPALIEAALGYAIQTLINTDFPARAGAIADEIAAARPHVIGVQELSALDIDLTGLGLPVVIALDFLPVLQAAMEARGLEYDLAVAIQNLEATPIDGITLIDRDAIFVDSRVTVNSTASKIFDFNVGEVATGVVLERGWVAIDATIGGTDYTILSTHLESGQLPVLDTLRAAQAIEIATVLGAAAPAIVMGDLNDVPGSLMYNVMLGAGFTDVWAALRPGAIGYTCCHVDDLSNPRATFYQRIDQIWTRGIGHPRAGAQGTISITGKVPASRLDGPEYLIWPSDHAGVVANLLLAPAWGVRGD